MLADHSGTLLLLLVDSVDQARCHTPDGHVVRLGQRGTVRLERSAPYGLGSDDCRLVALAVQMHPGARRMSRLVELLCSEAVDRTSSVAAHDVAAQRAHIALLTHPVGQTDCSDQL